MDIDWRLDDKEFLRLFRLPGSGDKHDMLQLQNPLPRDRRIVFDEENHLYTIDAVTRAPRSVTALVHDYGSEFAPAVAIAAMKAGARWEEKKAEFVIDGREMSDAEIIEAWRRKGRVASARGTLLHYHAELLLNNREDVVEKPYSPRPWVP